MMQDVLLVSQWFYAGGTSVLIWMTACALIPLIALVAVQASRGAWHRFSFWATAAFSGLGAFFCLALILAESVVFELGSPLSIAAYVVLLGGFIGIVTLSRSERSLDMRGAACFLVISTALTYLFVFGSIPQIFELKPEELEGIEGTNALGKQSDTLLVTEFADFECTPCATQDRIMDTLWSKHSDHIRYSFRHLPKRRHPHAEPAALASQCAAEQGVFWETKRLLFANQDRLGDVLAYPELPTIPAGGTKKYAECLQSRSAWANVSEDIRWAEKAGLRATPSVIVGNKLVQGVISYARLATIVRSELRNHKVPGRKQAGAGKPQWCGALVARSCSE